MKGFATLCALLLLITLPAFALDDVELTLGGSLNDTEGVGTSAALNAEGLTEVGPGLAGPAFEYRYSNPHQGKSYSATGYGAVYEFRLGRSKIRPLLGGRLLYLTGDALSEWSGGIRAGIVSGGEGGFVKVYAERTYGFGGGDGGDQDALVVALGFRL